VKRFLIVLLSFHLATGGILFAELAKLPFLSQHFQDHRKQNPQIDFAQFLWMHYVVNKHQHSDGNKCHTKLPLCCMHFSTAETVCALPPLVTPILLRVNDPICQKSNFPTYQFPILEGKLFGIFQPPKMA
jgi:hypothetical protein